MYKVGESGSPQWRHHSNEKENIPPFSTTQQESKRSTCTPTATTISDEYKQTVRRRIYNNLVAMAATVVCNYNETAGFSQRGPGPQSVFMNGQYLDQLEQSYLLTSELENHTKRLRSFADADKQKHMLDSIKIKCENFHWINYK